MVAKIPLLNQNSFRILGIKEKKPILSDAEIAAKTCIPVEKVACHLNALRKAKILTDGSQSRYKTRT